MPVALEHRVRSICALGQDPELIALAEIFVHYADLAAVSGLHDHRLALVPRAHGATRVILAITVAGVVVNALANYALIFGNWGFPRLELRGSGIATTTVNCRDAGARSSATSRCIGASAATTSCTDFFEADWPRFVAICRIGAPIGFMLLAEVALFTSASLLQGWLGEDEVAAHAVALQLASISFMVPLGLSQATTVRVGLALGEHDREGVRQAGWASLMPPSAS